MRHQKLAETGVSIWKSKGLILLFHSLSPKHIHEDVTPWKCIPHYLSFVRGIQW